MKNGTIPELVFLKSKRTKMVELFFEGGPIFMGLLTIVLVIVTLASVRVTLSLITRKVNNSEENFRRIDHIKSAGLFALICGLLGQLIGLFSAFRAIKLGQVDASFKLLAEGFKVSMISSIYGIIIFSISLFIWYMLRRLNNLSN